MSWRANTTVTSSWTGVPGKKEGEEMKIKEIFGLGYDRGKEGGGGHWGGGGGHWGGGGGDWGGGGGHWGGWGHRNNWGSCGGWGRWGCKGSPCTKGGVFHRREMK